MNEKKCLKLKCDAKIIGRQKHEKQQRDTQGSRINKTKQQQKPWNMI